MVLMNYPIPTGKAVSYQSREIRVPADMESLNTPILSSGTVPQGCIVFFDSL
jgi:hypothetical protein